MHANIYIYTQIYYQIYTYSPNCMLKTLKKPQLLRHLQTPCFFLMLGRHFTNKPITPNCPTIRWKWPSARHWDPNSSWQCTRHVVPGRRLTVGTPKPPTIWILLKTKLCISWKPTWRMGSHLEGIVTPN